MHAQLFFRFVTITRLTDGQNSHRYRPRLHSMQRGKKNEERKESAEI